MRKERTINYNALKQCRLHPPRTHTLESKDTKSKKEVQNSKNSHVKNVNNRKNHYSPAKLENQKYAKELTFKREGFWYSHRSSRESYVPSIIIPWSLSGGHHKWRAQMIFLMFFFQ